MAESPAVNASPLIYLARADRLDLLRSLSPNVVVPGAVADELRAYPGSDPAVMALDRTNWLQVVQTAPSSPAVLAWDLGPGESAVLAWGEANPGVEVIIDDLLARRCAASLAIPVRGTVGLVLIAKARGLIPAARPVVEELRRVGMYLSLRTMDLILRQIEE